jgi:predicted PhzF superfamily epimerase YddE/YHI9
MKMALTFYLVDVFAEAKYQGNQLLVILQAGHLTQWPGEPGHKKSSS